MANFFTLQDGSLTDISTYGYSLTSAEVVSNTTGAWLSTTDAYGPTFIGNGSTISAVAVHLSSRQANNTTDSLILKLSAAGKSVQTETYPISNFTAYDGSNNLIANYPLNWQILKLSTGYQIPNLFSAKISLAATANNVIALIGGSNNNFDKALIDANANEASYSSLTLTNTTLTSETPFSNNLDGSIYFNGSTSHLSVASIPTINFTSGIFTIECWVKYMGNISASRRTIVNNYQNVSNGWELAIDTNGVLIWVSGDTKVITGTTTLQPNTWYHISVAANSTTSTRMFLNGTQEGNTYAGATAYTSSSPLRMGKLVSGTTDYYWFTGFISNLRIIHGKALYSANYTAPTSQLNILLGYNNILINTISLRNSSYYNTLSSSYDNFNIGNSLKGSNVESRTIIADTFTINNAYIHNGATLNFPLTSSKTLTLVGSAGLQITSDGTLNIGTSSLVVPLSTTHSVVLSNTQIDVHNGGNLNVYGYPKPFTTNLVNDTISGTRTFTVTDNISGIWNVGDVLTFKPSLSVARGFDTLTLSSFTGANTFTTTSASIYTHTGSASYANIAGMFNLSRNVVVRGLDSTNRGTIRSIDAAKTSVNYAQLSNFGISSTNKNGLILGVNSIGSVTLSSSVIDNSIISLTGRALQNVAINNSIINKSTTVTLTSLSVNNVTLANNYILSSQSTGLQLTNLSGSINMSNNTTIGSLSYGTYISNNSLTGTYGANNFNSGLQGMYVGGNNTGTIIGGGLNSAKEGVYVDASSSNLSGVTFQNILALGNSSVGFKVSGNNLNYLTPVTLNINGLTASDNSDSGIEGYNISGNLSSLYFSNNYFNDIKTSIGNGPTIVDTGIFNAPVTPSEITFNPLTLSNVVSSSRTPYTNGTNFSGSYAFNGSSSIITFNTAANSRFVNAFNLGTGDMTIEAWVYYTGSASASYDPILFLGDGFNGSPAYYSAYAFTVQAGNKLGLGRYDGSANFTLMSTVTTIALNTWHHFAVTRVNGVFYFWANGNAIGSDATQTAIALNATSQTTMRIGGGYATGAGTFYINANMTGIKITKGVALYKQNFTPSRTSPTFDLNTSLLFQYPYGSNIICTYGAYHTNINIISGLNYNQTAFKNLSVYQNLSTSQLSTYTYNGFVISANKFENFSLENTIISSTNPFQLSSYRTKIEGSYLFNKCNSNVYGLSAMALTGYQSDVYTETGFSVMNENGLSGGNVRYLAAGTISYDASVVHSPTNPASEKLEPASIITKLRSSSKLVPIKSGTALTVTVYVKKSSNYTGSAPRLMLRGNATLGYSDSVLATSNSSNNTWELLTGTLPVSNNAGIFEIYVDCSGSIGSGTINIDDWNFS